MSLEQAVAADREGQLVRAAHLYEAAIARGDQTLPLLLDLALLYWQATDPGISAHQHLDAAFLDTASNRCRELLEMARSRYPTSTEVRFWQKYIVWVDLGEPFTIEDARALLREDPGTLIPAMRIFDLSGGTEATSEVIELLRRSRQAGTTGARYVVSVTDACLNRLGVMS